MQHMEHNLASGQNIYVKMGIDNLCTVNLVNSPPEPRQLKKFQHTRVIRDRTTSEGFKSMIGAMLSTSNHTSLMSTRSFGKLCLGTS